MTETPCHTVVAADRKLVVSLVVGRRMREQTHTLLQDTKRRLQPGIYPRSSPIPTRTMSRPS